MQFLQGVYLLVLNQFTLNEILNNLQIVSNNEDSKGNFNKVCMYVKCKIIVILGINNEFKVGSKNI